MYRVMPRSGKMIVKIIHAVLQIGERIDLIFCTKFPLKIKLYPFS